MLQVSHDNFPALLDAEIQGIEDFLNGNAALRRSAEGLTAPYGLDHSIKGITATRVRRL